MNWAKTLKEKLITSLFVLLGKWMAFRCQARRTSEFSLRVRYWSGPEGVGVEELISSKNLVVEELDDISFYTITVWLPVFFLSFFPFTLSLSSCTRMPWWLVTGEHQKLHHGGSTCSVSSSSSSQKKTDKRQKSHHTLTASPTSHSPLPRTPPTTLPPFHSISHGERLALEVRLDTRASSPPATSGSEGYSVRCENIFLRV